MKYSLVIRDLVLILLILSAYGYSQTADAYFTVSAAQYLEDAAKEKSIFGLDVFAYYDLNNTYPDGADKKAFMKSDDYKALLKELKEIKASHSDIEFKTWISFVNYCYFDQKSGEFRIRLASNTATTDAAVPKMINEIHFPKLPTKWLKDESAGFEKAQYEVFAFKAEKNKSDLIQKNTGDIRVYLLFKPTGVKKVSYTLYTEAFGEWTAEKGSADALYADQVRIILINQTTSEVYFDKVYK